MTHHVYRAYDHRGALLYVGVTNDLERRMDAHEKSSGWWMFHERVESEAFDSRAEAEAEETRLIRTLHPRWNRRDRTPNGPQVETERQKVEQHVWRQLNRLRTEQSHLWSRLDEVENEMRVLAFAVEGMTGGEVIDQITQADRKRETLRALAGGEAS
jgi:predicted GIY-YIG superfamily endonuclease